MKHPEGNVQMSERTCDFLMPLLKEMNLFTYVQKVSYEKYCQVRTQVQGLFELDEFRKCRINTFAEDIRNYPYALSNHHFNKDFSENLFTMIEGDDRAKDKVLITITNRYNNVFLNHNKALFGKEKELAFIGHEAEHEEFCKLLGIRKESLQYIKVKDALDTAKLMKGARGFIGNQGGFYSLAEMLKVNRLLLSVQFMQYGSQISIGPCNNHPIGGDWVDNVITDNQYKNLVDELLAYTRNAQ